MPDMYIEYEYFLAPTGNLNEFRVTGGSYFAESIETIAPVWGLEEFVLGDRVWSPDASIVGTYVGYFRHGVVLDLGANHRSPYRYYTSETDPPPRIFTITVDNYTPCFLAGTLIACPEGERPVEELVPGDRVLTAGGETRTVRWIGRQTVLSVASDPLRAYPIQVMAGALAEGLPRRDLFLSPGHALLIDGLLVHAGALVNGTTIRRVMQPGPSFCYFHIETEDHAVILAEGAPSETFLDTVSRRRFENYAEFEMLYGASVTPIRPLRMPRVKSARQLPVAIGDRLEARARELAPKLDAVA